MRKRLVGIAAGVALAGTPILAQQAPDDVPQVASGGVIDPELLDAYKQQNLENRADVAQNPLDAIPETALPVLGAGVGLGVIAVTVGALASQGGDGDSTPSTPSTR